MKKRSLSSLCAIAIALLTLPVVLHAQGGCENSPENPTIVLALIGSAAASISAVKNRVRYRKSRTSAGGGR